jgi:ABC-type arginine/histidine transport system permease subunit
MRRDKQETRVAVCINSSGYEASLVAGKLYRVIPDDEAASHGYIRVVDESGEDYGYSVSRFFPIDVPQALEKALASATTLQAEDVLQVRGARGSRTRFERALSKVRKTGPRTADRL